MSIPTTYKDKELAISKKTMDKVSACVEDYTTLFPKEFRTVVEHIKNKRWLLDDEKFGESKENSVITRALFEIPVTLDTLIMKVLDPNEIKEFRGLQGSRWFAQKFKMFRTADEV